MKSTLRRLLVVAAVAGTVLVAQQLLPKPAPGRSTHGPDGFRKNLFRGILPPATQEAR